MHASSFGSSEREFLVSALDPFPLARIPNELARNRSELARDVFLRLLDRCELARMPSELARMPNELARIPSALTPDLFSGERVPAEGQRVPLSRSSESAGGACAGPASCRNASATALASGLSVRFPRTGAADRVTRASWADTDK